MLAPSAASDHQPNRPRPRGRPRGSATQDLRQKHLGLPHFAFLRAWLQGFDLAQAWDRFLAFQGESGDLRHVRATRARLWMQLLDDAQALNDSLPPEQRIDDVLERLQSRESKPKLVELPSLETFCSEQGLELDFYSEQELLQLMREHYGLDQVRDESDQESFSQDGVQISPQVRALNTLQTYLAKPLLPTDSIALWVSAALSRRLALAGVATVDDLVRLQAACGPTWYRKVQGLGQVRADRLLGWLQSHGLLDAAAAKPVAEIVATAIVPLEQLGIPQALQGRSGGFRAMGPNAYGAECDQQAWDAWLRPYEGQPRTWETYRREIERFVLWAVLERSLLNLPSHLPGRTASPEDDPDPGKTFFDRWWANNGDIVETCLWANYVLAIRALALLTGAIPMLALAYAVGLTDGASARAIRRADAGRESANLYHRFKIAQLQIIAVTFMAYLAWPTAGVRVEWVIVAMVLLCAICARMQLTYYKKYA